jgi:hypothetical protein
VEWFVLCTFKVLVSLKNKIGLLFFCIAMLNSRSFHDHMKELMEFELKTKVNNFFKKKSKNLEEKKWNMNGI